MNTNSNTYTVIYSIILVVVVAAVLAFAAMFLKPTQEANVKKDTIGQILTAATVQGEDILATYQQEIESAILVDINGEKVRDLDVESCEVYGTSDLKRQIAADSISFELAARIYSQDPKSAVSGGLMADENTGSTLFEKDLLKPADYSVIKDMKEGEISEPFESLDDEGRSGNLIYKIIKLEKIIPSHTATVDADFAVVQAIANRKRQLEAINEFVKEKQVVTYIKIDDLFKQCNFEREGWIK